MDNFKDYGVEVSDVKMVLPQMMKQKDKAVNGLTAGIEGLFKKYKVSQLCAVQLSLVHDCSEQRSILSVGPLLVACIRPLVTG